MIRRISALLLCAALLLSPALAAGQEAADAAGALHSLGLFQGTIAGRFDEESMALDREATRAEALVMFVRLLGREETARTGGRTHDFSDVPSWADPYVGYAYQEGLTKGAGGGRFGSAEPITLGAYATFLLRALGYQEGTDFTWKNATDKGRELGLYDGDFTARCQDGMTRGDLAQISYAALSQDVKGGGETLIGLLVRLGLADGETAAGLGLPLASAPADHTAEVQAVLALVNEARQKEGVGPLTLSDALTECAMVRAEEIADHFAHQRPNGSTCFTILDEHGVDYSAAAENIASGFATPEAVVEGWLNSPGHRANIMDPALGRLGVGVMDGNWVQLFTD